MGSKSGIDQDKNEWGKKKRYTSPNACESASFGRPWRGRWISTASLKLTVEVAEVVQGVDDELPLRGTSAMLCWYLRRSGKEDMKKDQRGQPVNS